MHMKRIAFLNNYLNVSAYQMKLFQGLVKASQNADVELCAFIGGAAGNEDDDELEQRNTAYGLFDPADYDGILVSTTLGAYVNEETFSEFLAPISKVPVVLLGPGPSSFPQVVVDNKAGMEQLIDHFIQDHGYRKIAFVTGFRGHRDAEERFETYKKCLEKAGIPFDERLVHEGHFIHQSGVDAVRILLDERKLDFDAIICSNDDEAAGVYDEMSRRGKMIPSDFALGGFDDTDRAPNLFPGLTTVNQSLSTLCEKALQLLCDMIDGKRISGVFKSPAELVVRSTCGCTFAAAERTSLKRGDAKAEGHASDGEIEKRIQELVSKSPAWGLAFDKRLVRTLYDSLEAEIFSGRENRFSVEFDKYLRECFDANIPLSPVQDLLSELNRLIHLSEMNESQLLDLEDIVHRSRVVVEQIELIRKNKEHQEQLTRYDDVISAGNTLSNALTMEDLIGAINHLFPPLGIGNFLLSVYQSAGDASLTVKPVALLRNGEPVARLETSYDRKKLFPPGQTIKTKTVLVYPSYVQGQTLGFLAFEFHLGMEPVIWNLVLQLNRSLFTLQLLDQLRDTENRITDRSRQIEKLIRPMLDSIEKVSGISDEQSKKADEINSISLLNAQKVKGIFSQTEELHNILLETNKLVLSIEDISETINIVALNASIQAARAGTYGRGFSVIAGEVRKLSNSTAKNVEQINNFLMTIKDGFENFIGANKETGSVLLDMSERISALTSSLQEVSGEMVSMLNGSNEILGVMKDDGV